MGDAPFERSGPRELLIDVNCVVIAGCGCEEQDVRLRNGFRKGGAYARFEVFNIVTADFVHLSLN
jgi:hypothetical protein